VWAGPRGSKSFAATRLSRPLMNAGRHRCFPSNEKGERTFGLFLIVRRSTQREVHRSRWSHNCIPLIRTVGCVLIGCCAACIHGSQSRVVRDCQAKKPRKHTPRFN